MNEISPMFAVQAEQLLLAGMPEEAVELCLEGLEVYPGYAAAFAILVKAYIVLGAYDKAQQLVRDSNDFIMASSLKRINEYLKNSSVNFESESLNRASDFNESANSIEFDKVVKISENILASTSDNRLFASDISIIPGLDRFQPSPMPALFTSKEPVNKDKLLKIARKQSDYLNIISSLNNAEVIKPEISQKEERRKSSVVVTETIAGILAQQGAFDEAKAAYLELTAKYPDKSNYFQSKIDAIDRRMG